MKYMIVILLTLIPIQAYTVHDLSDKKYVLIQTTDTFTFNETRFLNHVFDLKSLFKPFNAVINRDYKRSLGDEILIE